MNIHTIFNFIIIIFILHIIILNIQYSYSFGNKSNVENYENNTNNTNGNDFDTLDFLKNNDTNNKSDEEFKKKLLKYAQADYEPSKENTFEKKNIFPVEASNTYLNDNNQPNFESNVADTAKFYNINYDNLNETNLRSTSIQNLRNYENLNKEKLPVSIDTVSNQPCTVKEYGRESTTLPDNWSYKNEIPMNGGSMNGIFGFDSLESQFAIYNPNKLTLQTVKEDNNFKNIPHDDLRKPIIYEN